MSGALRTGWVALAAVVVGLAAGGCPTEPAAEFVAGGTGSATVLRDPAEMTVLTPASDIAITGGTQIEVNWQGFARTRTSVFDVILDEDQDPNNGNETVAFSNLPLSENQALVDTTNLAQGTYYIGVVIVEVDAIPPNGFGYAPGQITIDQRPDLYFTSPRGNLAFDRTQYIIPQFEVTWVLSDPDTSNNTVEVYLDPDDVPNGNEVFLYRSTSQTGDSFQFDLPTYEFEPGTYRLLALVTDGRNSFPFYYPGSLRLRARLAGAFDLRELDQADSPIAGAIFEGFNPHDAAGSFCSSLGDIDGDGFNDFIIMSQFAKPRYQYNLQRTGAGEAYVVYGRRQRFTGRINLNSTGSLFRGEIYTGVPEVVDPVRPSRGITSFALMSDWDADGVRELAFGVPFTDSQSLAFSLIGDTFCAPLDLNGYFRSGAVIIAAGSSLRPDLGFPGRNIFNLAEFGTLGHEPHTDANCREGFYGPKSPDPAGFGENTYFHRHLCDIGGAPNSGSVRLGCRFSSAAFGDQFGETVSSWDFDSIIMSAPNRDPLTSIVSAPDSIPGAGVISVFFVDVKAGFYPWSNTQAPPANTELGYPGSAQTTGVNTLPHGGPYHYLIDDLAYAPGYYVDPEDGEPCGLLVNAAIVTPDRSVRFWSNKPGARLSNAVGIGDLSADGLLDLMIGAPLANDGNGACYIIFGRVRELMMSGELQLEELGLPMGSGDPDGYRLFDGIQIVGAPGERLGQSQDDAGDFNNDGYGDVVIGSPMLNNGRGGAAVFFGSRDVVNLTETEIPFMELPQRGLGVVFIGQGDDDLAGARVAGAGDVDGDGSDDILIAAPNRSVRMDLDQDGTIDVDRTECGVVYLVYGAPDLIFRRTTEDGEPGVLDLAYIGTEALPGVAFIGRNSNDRLGAGLGEQGDRSFGVAGLGDVDGDGVGDLLLGSVSASPRNRAAAGEAYLLYGVGD